MTFHLRKSFVILPLSLFLAAAASADRYVARSGQVQGTPYDSWANAASNIQTAVNAASAGETVWVSNGVYRSTANPVVSINKSLSLRSVVANTEAVIDGEGVRRGFYVPVATPMTVVIEGFTVSNCLVGGAGGGAGMFIDNTADVSATVTVENCVLFSNRCGHTSQGTGGGIYFKPYTSNDTFHARVANCDFTKNYAGSSGGGLMFGTANQAGEAIIEIEDCNFVSNSVEVWNPFADPPVAAVNSRSGGAISINHCGLGSLIRNCTIEGNRSSIWGGGILARYNCDLLIENCRLLENVSGWGAGILMAGHTGQPTNIVRNCLFARNWALTNDLYTTSAGRGAGIQIGNVVLGAANNVRVENCTVVSNRATRDAGGVYAYTSGGMALWNTIAYYNSANGNASSNYHGTAAGWTNCLVGTGNVLPGSGNITDQNPAFIDFDGQDYHLTRTSPCVDNGYNLSSWMDAEARDLDGNYRVRPAGGDVDIGAYEYQPKGTLITIL